jgi:DNA-directed RNA polymerase subunit RPC12/RpoP
MWNDGKRQSQLLCKVCQSRFNPGSDTRFSKNHRLKCPHCNHTLVPKKDRKHFIVHK